jgi:hypothetical protein
MLSALMQQHCASHRDPGCVALWLLAMYQLSPHAAPAAGLCLIRCLQQAGLVHTAAYSRRAAAAVGLLPQDAAAVKLCVQ